MTSPPPAPPARWGRHSPSVRTAGPPARPAVAGPAPRAPGAPRSGTGAGLAVFGEPILQSEAVLIRPRSQIEVPQGLEVLARRLQYVLVDYDVPTALVEQAVAITPGLESPTVLPLHNREWSAVRAMVHRDETNQVMDTLYDLGARAILVTSIHACRL